MAPGEVSKRIVKKASKMLNPIEKFACLPAYEDRKALDGYSNPLYTLGLFLIPNLFFFYIFALYSSPLYRKIISFETFWATHLSGEQMKWVFDLFSENMFTLYSMSQWGWDPESKRQELSATTARFIIAKNDKGERIGYTHYRFDVDHEFPVIYCYEIQVVETYQKKGIGTMLIHILETLGERTGMEKIMATVFAFNEKSLGFFHKLGYETDVTCPDENQGRDYLILSKTLI
uniref:N-alpha-acetyltransferase 40 n=1 Tax=Heterorhabditis bacteriophora TaxID=37862 RepID=A0A1I7WCM5_HETBA